MTPRDLAKRLPGWVRTPLARMVGAPNPVRDGYAAWLRHERRAVPLPATGPGFSLVMPTHETPAALLRAAIGSVRAQTWPHWQLCIADDASTAPHVRQVLQEEAARDMRIAVTFRGANGHISAASNSALALATGEWVVPLDHDDLLAPDALAALAGALATRPEVALAYTDEDKLDAKARRFDPAFKGGFDPERLLGQNLVNHLAAYRRDLVVRLGGWREGLEGSQDYDLTLRVLAAAGPEAVIHIPGVFYHWRQAEGGGSFSQGWLERCAAAGRRAVGEHLRDSGAVVEPAPKVRFWNRVRWPKAELSVCLAVLPSADSAASRAAAEQLAAAGEHPVAELHVAPSGGAWAARVGAVLRATRSDIVVIAGDRPVLAAAEWLAEIVAQLSRPDVGAVGGPSLTPRGRLRHAELAIAPDGRIVAAYAGARATETGYFGDLALVRRVAALSGGFIALRRAEALDILGAGAAGDVALCQALWARGRVVLWTPYAPLVEAGEPDVPGLDPASRWDGAVCGPGLNALLEWRGGRPALRSAAPGK